MSSREKKDREEENLQVSPDTSIFHIKTLSIQRRERRRTVSLGVFYPDHVPTEQLLGHFVCETCTKLWITPLTQTEFTLTHFKVTECHKHYVSGAHVKHNPGSVHGTVPDGTPTTHESESSASAKSNYNPDSVTRGGKPS